MRKPIACAIPSIESAQYPAMKFLGFVLIIAAAIIAWSYLHRPIEYAPGVLIPSEPEQTITFDPPLTSGDYQLIPLAHFALDARVLHRKIYRWDRVASLVPVDLALGWGPMSDQRVLDQVSITQSMRFYWFAYRLPPPIPKEEIISHSTNVHVIPATAAIESQCKSLRTGELVHLSGDLVEATAPGRAPWRSSLSRTDTGNGACELMWVNELSILSAPSLPDQSATVKR
jgi:hypothetical protein